METPDGPFAARPLQEANGIDDHPPQKRALSPLPILLSSFIGRERELADVKRLVAAHRLLTLTGPGGCGKSRLALAAAADLAEAFEDQISLVEFAALATPALVPQALAGTLGVREQPHRPITDSLIEALHSRRVLLLLDNCEHLIAAVAVLAETLLRACPSLHLLATSREALRLHGETVWPVPSLSWPDPDRLPPLDHLEQYDAVRLFVERTTAVVPSFGLTPQNARAVAQLCQHVDGLPLALELAAAQMPALSVEQLVARLEHSLHLFQGGSRTALPRQQTLRATIDWSYALLSEQERTLFHRLSVFAGGFTLAAAESVCAGDGLAHKEVLSSLASLVQKSLVVVVEHGDEGRYRLLETVRQYAQEKLELSGEAIARKLRHAAFFLTLAETAEPKLKSAERGRWLDRLEKDQENLRAALGFAHEQQEVELALRLAGGLAWFWYFRGTLSEARGWLEAVLALEAGSAHSAPRAKAIWGAGALAWVQGDYTASRAFLEESMRLWRAETEQGGLAYALTLGGLVMELHGEHERARALQEESLALFRQVGDQWGLALALYWLGDTWRIQREHAPARALFEESLALFRKLGDPWGMALALQGLGAVAYRQSSYAEARRWLEGALHFRQTSGDKWLMAQTLNTLGITLQRQGAHQQASASFEQSLALYREVGDSLGIAHVLRNLAEEALQQGDHLTARSLLQERLALAERLGHPGLIASALAGAAREAAAQHQPTQAVRLFGAAERWLTTSGESFPPGERTRTDEQIAALRLQLGSEAFAEAWAAGQAMPLEAFLALPFPHPQEAGPPAASDQTPTSAQAPARAVAFPNGLTAREVEVLRLVAQGWTDAQIAAQLVISPRTVNAHLTSIYRKIGVSSRYAATHYAQQQQLV